VLRRFRRDHFDLRHALAAGREVAELHFVIDGVAWFEGRVGVQRERPDDRPGQLRLRRSRIDGNPQDDIGQLGNPVVREAEAQDRGRLGLWDRRGLQADR
jgi:hypothetical protein